MADVVRTVGSGAGPVLVEAATYRWHGHYEGDTQPYTPEDEAAGWNDRDPLRVAGENIVGAGLETEARLQEIRDEARVVVEAAVEAARAADPPALEEAYEHVYRD
jgi:TPP-dependent pyruvate/acetoin dehydrogenase alpha subunit